MVGLFTTEATIKIKHFRRRAHSNGKTLMFSAASLTAKQLLHGAKGENANTHPGWALGRSLICDQRISNSFAIMSVRMVDRATANINPILGSPPPVRSGARSWPRGILHQPTNQVTSVATSTSTSTSPPFEVRGQKPRGQGGLSTNLPTKLLPLHFDFDFGFLLGT